MAKFMLKKGCGPHADRAGKTYQPGSVIESDSDLAKQFPERWERVRKKKDEDEEPVVKEVEEEEDAKPDMGKEVTDSFFEEESAFKVFKKEKLFFVYESDDLESPLNKEPLKNKKAVEVFLESFNEK